MLHIDIDSITEDHLQALCHESAEEGLRLEFKREIDLSSREGKFETAKDVAAMANAAGGRIVYGIDEVSQEGGPATAAKLVPLENADLIDRHRDVLYGLIFPPPRFRSNRVDLAGGGFALVTEVYSSAGRELHGVRRREEIRFWRRGMARNQPMTEPEIREAYARIAISSQRLEEAIENQVGRVLAKVAKHREHYIVVPWFARPNLADPRLLIGISDELVARGGPLSHLSSNLSFHNLRPFSEGITMGTQDPHFHFAITRTGIVHLAEREAVRHENAYAPQLTFKRLMGALGTARLILGRVGYWGPVRVLHDLTINQSAPEVAFADGDDAYSFPAGQYRQQVSEVRLDEAGTDLEPIAREIMDQVYHIVRRPACPWFDQSGHLSVGMRAHLWSPFPPVGAPP
jgi:hypothetical protein